MHFDSIFFMPNFRDLFPYAGEIILLFGLLLFLLHFTFLSSATQESRPKYPLLIEYSSRSSFFLLTLVEFFFITSNNFEHLFNFNGSLLLNNEILLFKSILVFLAMIILLVSETFFKQSKLGYFEYNILFLCSLLGCLLTLSSNDFLSLYISLEIQALAFYIMATIKKSATSSEAGLKYFIIGSFSSALLLFGISLVVLLTGQYTFENVALFLFLNGFSFNFLSLSLVFGTVLILIAILIKLAIAPFHEWVGDVYEGILTPTALFFATIPKISNFFILTRLVSDVFSSLFEIIQILLIFVCILSLILGCLNAFKQQNIKRFLAFSSVNHFGFILMGLLLGTQSGISASFFYLSFYIILTFGMWTALILLTYVKSVSGTLKLYQLTRITELGTLVKTNPGITLSIFLTLVSMGAVPPLAGFNAKVSVFYVLISEMHLNPSIGLNIVLICAFFSSLLSVYYYIRVIKILTFIAARNVNHQPWVSTPPAGFLVLAFVTTFNIFSFILFL